MAPAFSICSDALSSNATRRVPENRRHLEQSNLKSWKQLIGLSEHELGRLCIASVNMACGVGLPGCDGPDIQTSQKIIDEWAARTQRFIEARMPRYEPGHGNFPASEAQFRIQLMITHLQRDIGIRYRLDKRSDNAELEASDTFVQGIMKGQGGTCGSLPVLYTAVGRRLGYPLKLASAKFHLYMIWEDPIERFNIEASGDGMSFYPDHHYCTGNFDVPVETVRQCGFMKPQTPLEEFSAFLSQRGECWLCEKDFDQATESFAYAHQVNPDNRIAVFQLRQAMDNWDRRLHSEMPRHFPSLNIEIEGWRFFRLPHEIERDLIRMKIVEGLLRDKKYRAKWWEPLRHNQGSKPCDLPDASGFVTAPAN